RAGGVDYIIKPFQREEVLARVQTHLEINRLARELEQRNGALSKVNAELAETNHRLKEEIAGRARAETARAEADERFDLISQNEAKRWGIEGFCGRSKTIARILEDVRQLQQTGTTSVLIQGESGTGKELVARAIHFGSSQQEQAFLVVNCSAIPAELAESAFFGHVRGAFTGANATRRGYFELADGGTLFLDEIGDMSQEIQAKLLRVLEDGCVVPVGGAEEKQVHVRVIAATHVNLPQSVAEGRFRQDLFYRLARFVVDVPPLRERLEDVPLLIDHFCALFAEEMAISTPRFSTQALQELMSYSYPGNVRELKNIVEFALIKSGGDTVGPEHLHMVHIPQPGGLVPGETAPDSDDAAILAYVQTCGRISNADCRKLLSVDRRRATYLLDKLCTAGFLVRVGSNRGAHYTASK
ncbi:MAG: sigma-54 dependent transcriptional regulator, partial [bacterium]|nr:sigma-54 dependent transcriptional regulator [bacterium]